MEKYISILLFQSDGSYVAQCIEHDLCVQGSSISQLENRFLEVLVSHLADGGLEDISMSPNVFLDRFLRCRKFFELSFEFPNENLIIHSDIRITRKTV